MTVAELGRMLETLPDTALLPVSWLRAQLELQGVMDAAPAPLPRDLTVKEFGACFGKSASTARLWCEQGKVDGAWKLNGREWRIPVASVDRFREAQGAPSQGAPPARGKLGDWRAHRKAG